MSSTIKKMDGKALEKVGVDAAKSEAQIAQLYSIAALAAQREDDLDKIAEI